MRTSLAGVCAALLALSCIGDGDGPESPRPTLMEPSSGFAASSTRVVIHGEGFLARPSEAQSGGGAELDASHRVWLDDVELGEVVWIDTRTLHATVPAGLPVGLKRLVVENAFGRRGALDRAFEVTASPRAVLEATLSAAPETVNVGQSTTITLAVRNAGGAAARDVVPDTLSLGGTAAAGAALVGPAPAVVARLEPGAVATFTWSVSAAVPGTLSLLTRALAADDLSSVEVSSSAAEAFASVQAPAELVATLAASRATANVGQAVTVTLTLVNGGAARADLTAVTPGTIGPAASCGAVTPALPQSVATGDTLALTWTCTASAPGTLSLSAAVTGTDGTSGAPLSVTPAVPALVAVQTPAALSAAIAVQGNPATVPVGTALLVTLTVGDTGEAGADVTRVEPVATPLNHAACGAPSPAPPQALGGLGTTTFTWSCTALAAGSFTLGATVAGTDANTGGAIGTAAPGLALDAQIPAVLVATVGASRSTANVGQAVTVTFTLINGGSATADITAVAPAVSGTATATCGAVSPLTASISGGHSRAFTWTCTASTSGTLVLSGTATGTDHVSGAPLSATPAAPAEVTVQTPAVLAASSFLSSRSVALTGQPAELTLVLANSGEAAADLVAIVPSATPGATASCTAAAPAPPQRIGGGTSLTLSWSCSATAAGSYWLGAIVSATDANTGQMLQPPIEPLPLAVQTPAALAVTAFTADRSTASVGQAVAVTLTVGNGGGTAATVNAVTPSIAPAASAGCTAASPAPPQTLPAGGRLAFTWTCTASAAGSYALRAAISGADGVTNAPLSASAGPLALAVQSPASLSASIAVGGGSPLVLGQPASVTLTVSNGGGATANVSTVTPSAAGTAAATCTAVSPTLPRTVAGGANTAFTWTCTPTAAGTLTLSASVSGTDANSGAAIQASAPGVTRTVVSPAGLAVTSFTSDRPLANTGQAVTVTLIVGNGGGTAATVNAVTPSVAPAASPGCTAAAPAPPRNLPAGGSLTFTWTCTVSAAGSYALGAAISGVDAVTSAPLSAGAGPLALSVVRPASLSASIAATPESWLVLGQPASVTLTLSNGGDAAANVSAVTPTATGTARATCTAASPALPRTVAGGTNALFTWTCTPTETGTLVLSAAVSGTDANTGAALSASADPGVTRTVASGTVLTVSAFTADRSTVSVGQPVAVTLTIANGGQNPGSVGSIVPSMTPAGSASCTGPTPAPPVGVPGGGSVTFGWTCTATSAGIYTLGATIAATDAGGQPVPLAPTPISVTVQAPALFAPAALQASRTTAGVGQAITVTLVLANQGEAGANVSSMTAGASGTGAATCGAPSPAVPRSIAGGASVTFTWTCTGTAAGAVALSAAVLATDANTGGDVSPTVSSVGVAVQTAAALSGALTPASPSVPAGTPVGVTLVLENTGQATAQVSAVTPSIAPADASCDVAASPPSQAIGGGSSASFTWTCTAANAGSHTLGATVAATDANTGAALAVTVPNVELVVTEPPISPASEVVLVAVDPLGDGTAEPLIGESGGAVWVGPGRDGVTLAWLDPAGTEPPVLQPLDAGPSAPSAASFRVGGDVLTLDASTSGATPISAGATPAVTTLTPIEGIVYAADAGGIARSARAQDGGAGGWIDVTPSDPAWRARVSVAVEPAPAAARWQVRDRAVPAIVPFGRCGEGPCVLAARNVAGGAGEPPVAPQLWRCAPSGGPGACLPADWSLAAPDPEGPLTRLGDARSEALTVLAATERWLYVGLDAAGGVRLFRAAAAPRNGADLLGRGRCPAGSPGCEGLGGNGLGDRRVTRFLHARVLTVGGATSLWIVAGDGVGPARIYRVDE